MRLKYCYFACFPDDRKVLLLSEKKNALLSGRLYNLVLTHIQSYDISMEELAARLEGMASPAEIIFTVNKLREQGYITESAPSVATETNAYWNSMGMDVNTLVKRLAANPISMQTIDAPSAVAETFARVFGANGLNTNLNGVLKIFITDDYEHKEIADINREAMASKQPWMLVKPTGVDVWIGPLFVPGKTGCWECLRQRLKNNRPMNTFYKIQKKTAENPPLPVSFTPMSMQTAANLAAIEIIKWLYFGENEGLEGNIKSLDTLSCSTRSHVLVKRPQCEVCGDAESRSPQPSPVVLAKSASYCISRQGGYRETPLEDTLEKYKHHISPITGVVQKLEPYFPDNGGPVYNYSSGHNMALKSKTLLWLNHHTRGGNVGKGKTSSQAKAGALCEGIERYSCTFQGDEPCITGNLNDLAQEAVHPNTCMNYSGKQYQNRDQINKECSKFYFMVPVPFDQSLNMDWTAVYSLTRHTFKYFPSCFCYAQYPAKDDRNLFSYPDSNGCAAGNSLEEAVLQGFLELVERDAVAIWWYNMLRKPAVDLATFQDPYFIQLMDYYRSLDRSLYVLDITSDLQIPAFAAVSHRPGAGKDDIIFAFGAHVDAKIAVERALLELNQMLPIVNIPGKTKTGTYRTEDKNFLHWLNTTSMETQPYLKPQGNVPRKKASDYPALCPSNVYDSILFCVQRAEKNGLETLVLDMTRPDVGLNVVKVLVPGLRHFWKRLAPGRLYDIPVKMGWLDTPLKEEELNPIGIFI
ncbi:MAG: TOMM precursor leader peptide-binding protein [bacterium]|nr:TOMM precursor leader peptide-binding protein [bacterium]